jgi:hypothetical protein
MQPPTLLLPATFAANHHPSLQLLPLLLLPGRHRLYHQHHGQTHCRPLPKKGNSSTTTSVPTAAQKRLQVQTTWTYLT